MAAPRIVALVSSFREGALAAAAIRSAMMLDAVLVADGPIRGNEDAAGEQTDYSEFGASLEVYNGVWESDAEKRTWMIGKAKERWPGPLWALWLDGDELLLYGEHLRDWLGRVLEGDDPAEPIGGWPIALVELDGSVAICAGKLVRVDLIRRYLASSSYIEMTNGARLTKGNMLYWTVPDGPLVEHWRARPPLHGEPHLQHRPVLRSSSRTVERQHVAEERAFRSVELPPGVNGSG